MFSKWHRAHNSRVRKPSNGYSFIFGYTGMKISANTQ
jgi:hypothetical protein